LNEGWRKAGMLRALRYQFVETVIRSESSQPFGCEGNTPEVEVDQILRQVDNQRSFSPMDISLVTEKLNVILERYRLNEAFGKEPTPSIEHNKLMFMQNTPNRHSVKFVAVHAIVVSRARGK
jgi:hypothetical protein